MADDDKSAYRILLLEADLERWREARRHFHPISFASFVLARAEVETRAEIDRERLREERRVARAERRQRWAAWFSGMLHRRS